PQDACLIVLSMNYLAAFGVRTCHISRRAIAADVIPTRLRIILDSKEARLRPKAAVAKGFDDSPQSKIVICHLSGRRWSALAGAASVIVGQPHDHKIRQLPGLFEPFQLLDEL